MIESSHSHDGVDEEDDDADGVERHEDAHGALLRGLLLRLDAWAPHGRTHARNGTGLKTSIKIRLFLTCVSIPGCLPSASF